MRTRRNHSSATRSYRSRPGRAPSRDVPQRRAAPPPRRGYSDEYLRNRDMSRRINERYYDIEGMSGGRNEDQSFRSRWEDEDLEYVPFDEDLDEADEAWEEGHSGHGPTYEGSGQSYDDYNGDYDEEQSRYSARNRRLDVERDVGIRQSPLGNRYGRSSLRGARGKYSQR